MTSAFSWQTLLAFAQLHFVLPGQTLLLLQVSLDILLLCSTPLGLKGHLFFFFFFGVSLEGLVGLHRTIQLASSAVVGNNASKNC